MFRSAGISVALGAALSVGASWGGSAFWRSRAGSGDILFGELMLWGWLRRAWIERQLGSALRLLDGVEAPEELSFERRRELLTKLASALEARDVYTHGHSRRVARTATMIAARMGLPHDDVAKVRTAAILHDVGKVNTPLAVLHKAGRLTDDEFGVIKQHPVDGAVMVSILGDAELTAMVRHHHERLDGTGYPDRLSGDRIPLGARIIAVADTFDAITSVRPYRGASPHKKAIDILAKEAGTQLDPAAVRAFDSCYAGRRPVAVWAALVNAVERLVSWFAGGFGAASSASLAPIMAVAAATGAIGGTTATSRVAAPASSASAARTSVTDRARAGQPGTMSPTGSGLATRASSSTVDVRSRTHRNTAAGTGSQRGRGSTLTAGGGPTTGGRGGGGGGTGGSGAQGAAGGSNNSGTGSSTSAGATPGPGDGGSSVGGGGTGVSTGSGGPSVTNGGSSVSTGSNGTSATIGGTSVSTGSDGPSVSDGGTSLSTGSNGTSVSDGGSSVSTGSNGTSVSDGGSSVSTGSNGTSVTVGGTSVSTGSGGPSVTVSGSGVSTGG
jgi:putative nucleotidyltransferase with HDIG domain